MAFEIHCTVFRNGLASISVHKAKVNADLAIVRKCKIKNRIRASCPQNIICCAPSIFLFYFVCVCVCVRACVRVCVSACLQFLCSVESKQRQHARCWRLQPGQVLASCCRQWRIHWITGSNFTFSTDWLSVCCKHAGQNRHKDTNSGHGFKVVFQTRVWFQIETIADIEQLCREDIMVQLDHDSNKTSISFSWLTYF